MKGLPIILLIGGGIAYYFLRGKNELVNQLRISVQSLAFNKSQSASSLYLSLFFDVRLKLANPTSAAVKITEIFVEIYANENLISSVTKNDNFNISVNSSTVINLTARVNTLSLGNQLLELFKNGRPSLAARGYVETSFGRIPFEKKFA